MNDAEMPAPEYIRASTIFGVSTLSRSSFIEASFLTNREGVREGDRPVESIYPRSQRHDVTAAS